MRGERAGRDYFAICDCLCIIECSAFDTITVEFMISTSIMTFACMYKAYLSNQTGVITTPDLQYVN